MSEKDPAIVEMERRLVEWGNRARQAEQQADLARSIAASWSEAITVYKGVRARHGQSAECEHCAEWRQRQLANDKPQG